MMRMDREVNWQHDITGARDLWGMTRVGAVPLLLLDWHGALPVLRAIHLITTATFTLKSSFLWLSGSTFYLCRSVLGVPSDMWRR